MRKELFRTLALCFAIATLCACSKDNSIGSDTNGSTVSNNKQLEQLRAFRKQIEYVRAHPDEKSNETITLSDALWDIENHFNLTYSDAECYYDQINDHEFTLSLPVDDQQQVLVYDAVALYEETILQAQTAIESDEFENKGFISLIIKEINNGNRGITITFSGKTGNRTNYNLPSTHLDGPFDAGDDWMFAAPLGKCDDPDIPSGADEQFQENLYAELIEPYIEVETGYRNIYIDRKMYIFDGTNYSGLYYNQNPDNLCIGSGYMNDYYSREKKIISRVIPNQYNLSGYSPLSIEVEGTSVDDGTAVTHRTEVEYGIRMKVRIDEFGAIESLIL